MRQENHRVVLRMIPLHQQLCRTIRVMIHRLFRGIGTEMELSDQLSSRNEVLESLSGDMASITSQHRSGVESPAARFLNPEEVETGVQEVGW